MTMHYHPVRQIVCDAVRPTGDPTGTSDLRRRYRSAVDMRWRRFRQLLRAVLVQQDLLGLRVDMPSILSIAIPVDGRTEAFQRWVDYTMGMILLEADATYLDPMIESAYVRAVSRALRLTRTKAQPDNMQASIHALQRLTVVEMQGVVEAVSQKLVRDATNAMLGRFTPAQAARQALETVDKIGVNRARAVIATQVVKAHAAGTLDTFRQAGIKEVSLVSETFRIPRMRLDARRASGPGSRSKKRAPSARTVRRIKAVSKKLEAAFRQELVEVETAGDELVCPECEDISADGPYSLDRARSLIPAHPNCRCTFVPTGQFTEEDD